MGQDSAGQTKACRVTMAAPWQVRDPLWAQGGLMKMAEGGLLLERLAVEEQGALSATPQPLCLSTSSPGGPDVVKRSGVRTEELRSSSSAL